MDEYSGKDKGKRHQGRFQRGEIRGLENHCEIFLWVRNWKENGYKCTMQTEVKMVTVGAIVAAYKYES